MTEQKRFGYIFAGTGTGVTFPFSAFYLGQFGINMNLSETSSYRFKISEKQDSIPSVEMSLRTHGKERTHGFVEITVSSQLVPESHPNSQPRGIFSLGVKRTEKGSNPLFCETAVFGRTDGTVGIQSVCGVEWDL